MENDYLTSNTTISTKTKKEIVDEVVKRFSSPKNFCSKTVMKDNIPVHVSYYYMQLENGDIISDAVAMFFNDEARQMILTDSELNDLPVAELPFTTSPFKEEYQGHNREFWQKIQELHDNDNYWEEKGGLSEKGKKFVNSI